MLPYRQQPAVHLGPFTWHAFTLLVIVAVVTGFWIFVLHAGRTGLDRRLAWRLYITVIVCGFLGAHLFKVALPNPRPLLLHPSLVFHRGGIASFGGVIGGVLGALIWLKLHRVSWRNVWRWLDIFAFVFPFAFLFGRLGCTLAHDHRGKASAGWLAFRYPEGARYNLGFIEFLFLVALSVVFLGLDSRRRAPGLYLCLWGVSYGAFRLWLDTLHVDAPRVFGVTPDQIGAGFALALGAVGLVAFTRGRA